VPVGVVLGNLFEGNGAGGESGAGQEIYHRRTGIVEPVFTNIPVVRGVDRFRLRGKIKVDIQRVLNCMVHNMVHN